MDTNKKINVLITGANGFIGYQLVHCINENFNVSACVRKLNEQGLNSVRQVESGDLNQYTDWSSILSGIDVVIHLAAVAHNKSNDLEYMNRVNAEATVNLAKQATSSGVKRFIFLSSIGVLGNRSTTALNENSIANPHSQYAKSKLLAENELINLCEGVDMDFVIIRPVLVYGKNAPGNFGKLVKLVSYSPILPFVLCKNKRSFISIHNLVDFISETISHPKAANEVFCISDGIDISTCEFTNQIAEGLSKPLIQIPMPIFLFKLVGKLLRKQDLVEQLIGNLQVDIDKAQRLLNWKPTSSMAETLANLKNKESI